MNFVPLNLQTVELVLVSDTSFENGKEIRTQLVYLICPMDDTGQAIFIHYGSNRCRWVVRSGMDAQVHALVLEFDYTFIIQHLLSTFMGRTVPVEAHTDIRTLLKVIAKDA